MWNIFSFEYIRKAGVLKVYEEKQSIGETAICSCSTKILFLKTLENS